MIRFDYMLSDTLSNGLETMIKAHMPAIDQIQYELQAPHIPLMQWTDVDCWGNDDVAGQILSLARDIRENGDVFILIGVGGSNQGARAVIEALKRADDPPDILYAGNTLSAHYLSGILDRLRGKSVYANIVAKNFATLEPGIHFRVIRQWMERQYGEAEAARRIIATGTPHEVLHRMADRKGYAFLPFPEEIGGRYSVLSPVGLLPIAAAGIDIRELLRGAREMARQIKDIYLLANPALRYACIRNLLYQKGIRIEILSYFEPRLAFLARWWVQLFGESEGKDGKGVYPTHCCFSEDLHSLGQYIQEGTADLLETFIHVENSGPDMPICGDDTDDGFAYLDGMGFHFLNRVAYEATLSAHSGGGTPCTVFTVPDISAHTFGQLFYFFMISCYISGRILGVNPLDQPGVEGYKKRMFTQLGGSR